MGQIFEIEDYSFDIEQTLNIGSQSSGAGAGKVKFNPFSITRKIDRPRPCCSTWPAREPRSNRLARAAQERWRWRDGCHQHGVGVRLPALRFQIGRGQDDPWSHDEESPKETVTFEYGGLQVRYTQQNPDGTLGKVKIGGWNRVRNIQDHSTTPL